MTRIPLFARRAGRDQRMTAVDHLDELRRRLMVGVVSLVVAFAAMYAVHAQLVDALTAPLPDGHDRLVTLSPTEPFMTVLKVTLWAAVLVALPVWLYQLYAFMIPAVADQSRRGMVAVVTGLCGLFVAGVAFGYAVVLPVALRFLLGFGEGTFDAQVRAGEYFGFATTMLLASGLLFEVPVAMMALARMGVASARLYRRHWRIGLVVMAAIAALLPGGDPLSMMLLLAPQLVLYAIGVGLAARFGTPRRADGEIGTAAV
ncbi:MAG: twin-arginine translocase subunit TatC [Thermoleophilia bacterium]|nr:twin-arginine translocase subunit TatC [Thermoleophilia bacterium]